MGEPVGRRIRDAAAILLNCAIIGLGAAGQRAAGGAEMVMPVKLVAGGDMAAQETKSVDAPAELRAAVQETKSAARQPSRVQRRRKPKMAGVPVGSPVVAQETRESVPQVMAQETKKADKPVKPQTEVRETGQETEEEEADPFASAKPRATVQKSEQPDPFAPGKPQATAQEAKPAQEARSAKETKPAKGGKKYRMAPIKWGVRVSETLGWLRESTSESGATGSSHSTGERTFTNTQTAQITASSYIMQPYIAQVGGGIGVVSSASHTNSTTSTSNMSSTSSASLQHHKRDNKLFGKGNLTLFARSRFPFSGLFSTTDSRANSELTSNGSVSKIVSLQQSYRPPSGPDRYSGSYNQNTTSSKYSTDNYALTAWNGSYSTRLGSNQDQPFHANARRTVSQSREGGGNAIKTTRLTAQHTYLPPDSLLSLNSNANLTESAQSDPALQGGTRARFLQASTVASWQPEDEDIPLYVTGNGRLFSALSTAQGVSVASKTLGGNVAATYDASNNLKYSADAGVTRSISSGLSDMITTQHARATYWSDAIKFENKSAYSWNANGGASNQTGGRPFISGSIGGTSGFNPRGQAGIGHSLRGPYELSVFGKNASLTYAVNQNLSVELPLSDNAGQISSRSSSLLNSASLGSGFSTGQTSGSASVSVADTRTTGGVNSGHTRSVSMQLGGQGRQPIYEGYGAKAEASVQVARAQDGRMQTNAAGVGTYTKYNIFGVRNLSYSGQLDITVQPSSGTNANVNPNDPNAKQIRPVSYELKQYLGYRMGMNEARLTGYMADRSGVKRASLLLQLRAWRAIGN